MSEYLIQSRLPQKYQAQPLRSFATNDSYNQTLRPSWSETLDAQFSYSYSRIAERIKDVAIYGRDPTRTGYYAKRDENYNAFDDLIGYEDYADFLTTHAVNSEHMKILKNRIESNKQTRQVLAESSLLNQFTAGFFDPINLIALPFGGPTVGIARSAFKVGAGVTALTAGAELIRAPLDPLNQPYEVPINLGMALGAGTFLGGLTGIIPTRKAAIIKRMENETDTYIANVGGIKSEEYFPGPKQIDRTPFKDISNEDLIKQKTNQDNEIKKLADEHAVFVERFRDGEDVYDSLTKLENKLSDLTASAAPVKIESKLRLIDDAMNGTDDFKIASNPLADGMLYNLVSVPIRRIINSNSTNKVKLFAMKLASDNGFGTTLEQLGLTLPKSVYQLSQMRYGKLYKVMQSLTVDWRNHGQKSPAFQKMTYNISNTSQRLKNRYNKVDSSDYLNVNPKDLTLQMYMKNINYHRIFKTPVSQLTEAQRRSIKALDDFYTEYNVALTDVGLLGSTGELNKSLSIKEKQLLSVKKELNAHKDVQPNEIDYKSILENRIVELTDEIDDIKGSLKFAGDVFDSKSFNPRFYNKDKILQNRAGFEEVLVNSFRRDPTIFVKRKGEWVSEILPIDEQSLAKRAKKVTDDILGINDIASFDNAYQGSGFSKHLRHRTIKATDQELFEFLEDDPLKIMRAYTSKVAPALEFARAFQGKNIFELRHEIYTDTFKNGGTIKKAQEDFRDFNQLYERIVGTTVKQPDRMSYKFANMVRSLAQLNFLGRAVYSTISEPAKLFHDHHYKDVFKGLFTLIEAGFKGEGGKIARMQAEEVMKAGEALDIVLQSTHLRFMDDLKSNPLQNNIWDKSRDVFFTLNGLAPVTNMLKQLDGIIRQHTLIDHCMKVKDGTATQQERLFLRRYNIDDDMAIRISKAKHQKTDKGLYFANTDAWLNEKQFNHITGVEIITSSRNSKDWPANKKNASAFVKRAIKAEQRVEIRDVKTNELITHYKPNKNLITEVIKTKGSLAESRGDLTIVYDKTTGEIFAEYPVGSNVNKVKTSYKPTKIYMDEEAIFDQFEVKAWTKPRVEGVKALPENAFKTKEDWKNFVQLHESFHVVYPRNKKGNKFIETKADYENRINDLALKEFNKQTTIQTETLETFRASLNTGVLNTILMGTPADKPIINDGIAYIPMSVARKFNMPEDARVKGYARIENGLLGLPFQFYSYSLAAVTKITGALVQGQVKNRTAAITSALMLAYLGQKLRTNEYTWDQLNYTDKFARAFDYSGLASLHTGILYEAFHTSLALDGPDISGGFLKPKYNVDDDGPVESVAGLAGAGPSIFFDFTKNGFTLATGKELDYVEGGINFVDGDRTDSAAEIFRRLPFTTLPGVYGISREIANTIEDLGD